MPEYGPNLLLNPAFSTAGAGGADVFGSWTESAGDGTISLTTTSGEFVTGNAAKLTAGTGRNTFIRQDVSGIIPGETYRLQFSTRGSSAVPGRFGVYNDTGSAWIRLTGTSGVHSDSFQAVTYDFVAPAGCTTVRLYLYCPDTSSAFACFDDIELKLYTPIVFDVVETTFSVGNPYVHGQAVGVCSVTGDYPAPVTWQINSIALVSASLTPPEWLTWEVPFAITDGTYETNLDITDYVPAGTEYWVDYDSGSDSNNGLSTGAPKKTLRAVLDLGTAAIINVKPHTWHADDGWNGRNRSVATAIRRWGASGNVTLSNHKSGLTWALDTTPGLTHCYKTSYTATIGWCFNAAVNDADGLYTRLAKQTSAANVEANAGSWYSDGTTVWIRLAGDAVPSDVRVYPAIQNGWAGSSTVTYLENIIFEGGSHAMRSSNSAATGKLYAKGCKFRYATSSSGNGVTFEGGLEAIFEDCTAEGNYLDGFKVDLSGSLVPNVALVRCIGRYNGWGNSDIGNGHSRHNGGNTVVVDCEFYGNYGANYHDIGDCRTWIVGSTAYSSRATSAGRVIDFACGVDGDDGKMYLHRCNNTGSTSTYDFESETGCEIEVFGMSYDATTGSGTVTAIAEPFELDTLTGHMTVDNHALLAIGQEWEVVVQAEDSDEQSDTGTITVVMLLGNTGIGNDTALWYRLSEIAAQNGMRLTQP